MIQLIEYESEKLDNLETTKQLNIYCNCTPNCRIAHSTLHDRPIFNLAKQNVF